MKFVLMNVYDKPKLETTKAVVSSLNGGQPDEGQNEQQQQQLANHSSDNEKIRVASPPSLTLSSHFPN